MRTRLYSARKYLPDTFRKGVLLYPFWGEEPPQGDDLVETRRFAAYMENAADLFEFTTIEEAAAAVLPFNWEQIVDYARNYPEIPGEESSKKVEGATKLAQELAAEAGNRAKPLVVFFVFDDETVSVPLQNALIFRPSLRKSTRQPNEHALPGWRADFVEAYCQGELPLRPKKSQPSVGYCGYDNPKRHSIRDKVRHRLGSSPTLGRLASALGMTLIRHPGARIRSQALHMLSRSPAINCNFIIRDAFWNGAISRHAVNIALARQSRLEYVNNMLQSDYVLCARGTGNYSFRFYEALSCGRIPIFINTECVLPYEEWVNWRDYCVWVEERDISHLSEIVADFHSRLSERQFHDMQQECRMLWLKWLSPQGFFTNLYRYLAQ